MFAGRFSRKSAVNPPWKRSLQRPLASDPDLDSITSTPSSQQIHQLWQTERSMDACQTFHLIRSNLAGGMNAYTAQSCPTKTEIAAFAISSDRRSFIRIVSNTRESNSCRNRSKIKLVPSRTGSPTADEKVSESGGLTFYSR